MDGVAEGVGVAGFAQAGGPRADTVGVRGALLPQGSDGVLLPGVGVFQSALSALGFAGQGYQAAVGGGFGSGEAGQTGGEVGAVSRCLRG